MEGLDKTWKFYVFDNKIIAIQIIYSNNKKKILFTLDAVIVTRLINSVSSESVVRRIVGKNLYFKNNIYTHSITNLDI